MRFVAFNEVDWRQAMQDRRLIRIARLSVIHLCVLARSTDYYLFKKLLVRRCRVEIILSDLVFSARFQV